MYTTQIPEIIKERLSFPLSRIGDHVLLNKVKQMTVQDVENLIQDIIGLHSANSGMLVNDLSKIKKTGEVAILDTSIQPLDSNTISNLLMYAEVIVVPDPFLLHPLSLRYLAPDHFNAHYPRSDQELKELVFEALRFYNIFLCPISDGIIIPSPFNALYLRNKISYTNFVGVTHQDLESLVPQDIAILAVENIEAKPVTFDGSRAKVHDFKSFPRSETSQIGLHVKEDPMWAHMQIETYMKIVGHEERDGQRFVQMAQAPPHSRDEFDNWIYESILKDAYNRMTSIQTDLLLSSSAGGTIITPSTLNWKFLDILTKDVKLSREQKTLYAIANMDLPSLGMVGVDTLTKLRQDESVFFTFRNGFTQAVNKIEADFDSPDFEREINEIKNDFVEAGLHEIKLLKRKMDKKKNIDLTLTTVSILASLGLSSVGALAWMPAILGIFHQIKSQSKLLIEQEELSSKPLYMLWRATTKPFTSSK